MHPKDIPTFFEGLLPPLVLISVLLLLLGIFTIRQRSGSHVFHAPNKGESFLLSRFLRNYWYWLLRPIEDFLVSAKVRPEMVNYVGLLCSVFAAIFYALAWIQAAGWALLFAGCLDMVDGQVARKSGRVSRRGAFLDSTLDRYSEFLIFGGLMVCFREEPVFWIASVFALGGSFMVSYCRARGEALSVAMQDVGLMQRAERLALLIAASLLTPLSLVVQQSLGVRPGLWLLAGILILLALGTNWTAWTRFRYVWIVLDDSSTEQKSAHPSQPNER